MFALATASARSVTVPSEEMILSKDEWRYMASGVEAPLCAGESDLPFTTKISDKYTITPMSKYEFGGTVTLKRLNAMFRIEMSEENTGEVRYVEGRWHGTFYHSISTENSGITPVIGRRSRRPHGLRDFCYASLPHYPVLGAGNGYKTKTASDLSEAVFTRGGAFAPSLHLCPE